MLQAFREALTIAPLSLNLINGHDKQSPFDRATITMAIVWQPSDDFFDGLVNLEYVFAIAAGVDQLLKHPGLPQHVPVVRLQDAGMAAQMGEYVMYGVLKAQRQFHEMQIAQTQSRWTHGTPVTRASDVHVGILGAGTLGSSVAAKLALNGYPVSCWSSTAKSLGTGVTNMHGQAELPAFLERCNVLVCLLALTPETHGILNMALFRQLPKGAYIINCARGGHLVDVDLLNALNEEILSGALLDVFHEEPLPQTHPFWQHPRIVVTPHEAAKSLVHESVEQLTNSMIQVQRGQTPDGLVDRLRGY